MSLEQARRPRTPPRSRPQIAAHAALGICLTLVVLAALNVSPNNAKASEIAGTWESGGYAPFTALECPHPATQFQLVTSPVREGSHAARFNITGNDVWSNGIGSVFGGEVRLG